MTLLNDKKTTHYLEKSTLFSVEKAVVRPFWRGAEALAQPRGDAWSTHGVSWPAWRECA